MGQLAPPSARRRRWRLLLAYALLLLPTLVVGAVRAIDANNNSPLDWVESTFAPKATYEAFCELFGPGDTVVISWPGCTLYESRLDPLVDRLRNDSRFFTDDGEWLFHSVASGREAAIALTAPAGPAGQPPMSPDQAIDRLRPTLVGPDRRTTAVVVVFTPHGLDNRSRLVASIRDVVSETAGVPAAQLRLAGPVIDGLGVDKASHTTLATFAAPSSMVVFLLCWLGIRSFVAATIVFGLSLVCQAATLALVHYSGSSMSALLIVLPPMVQVLTVAGGLHLSNYYFDSGETGERGALAAVRDGWAPCLLSAATTAVGMGSLLTSSLSPIREFGAFAAAGVMLSAVALLGVLPALYTFFPVHRRRKGDDQETSRLFGAPSGIWAANLTRYRGGIVAAGIAAIVVGGYFASKLTASVRIETLFLGDSRVISDYAWLEQNVGPLVPLDVVLTLPEGGGLSETDRHALLRQVEGALEPLAQLSTPVSAASLAAPAPDLSAYPAPTQAEMTQQLLAAQRPLFESLGLVRRVGSEDHLRLTVRTAALGDADYGELLAQVERTVSASVAEASAGLGAPVGVRVTGIMPLVHEIQQQLLQDLLSSFAGALVLITVAMTLVEASVVAGVVAMAPNVFPMAVYFGYLGWQGSPIDIGVVMTASIALGIAVDDTLHFLSFFRRLEEETGDRVAAVCEALRRCGPAMVQTSVSCGLGLLVFAFSDFAPTRGFALSMAVLMGLALAGDLILLPALLLATPGRAVPPRAALPVLVAA